MRRLRTPTPGNEPQRQALVHQGLGHPPPHPAGSSWVLFHIVWFISGRSTDDAKMRDMQASFEARAK